MMVAVAVMIGSFRDTVVYWVGQTLQADLFIGPGVQPTAGSAQTLSPDGDRRRARRIPAVEAVDTFRNLDLVYQGNLVVLGAGEVRRRAVARLAALQGAGRRPRGAGAAPSARDAVIVSEAFANRYGAAPGDTHAARHAARATGRSRSWRSTTTTPSTAA